MLAGTAGVYVDRASTAPWTRPSSEFVAPFGMFTAAEFALIARRHMEMYGTTSEALATVAATIRNKNTRMAYFRAVTQFFAWCDTRRLALDLGFHAARSMDRRGRMYAEPEASRAVQEAYPVPVRNWISRRGGLSSRMLLLRGRELLGVLDQIDFSQLGVRVRFDEEFKRFNKFQRSVLQNSNAKRSHADIDLKTYAKYVLKEGTNEERRELMGCFTSKITVTQGVVTVEAM